MSLWEPCAALEKTIADDIGGTTTAGCSIDSGEAPLLQLAIVRARRDWAVVIEKDKERTFDEHLIATLDEKLKAYDELMNYRWFENNPTERMPQLTDFVFLAGAVAASGITSELSQRRFDEKFQILQTPLLLQEDIAYYRAQCELRGSSLAVAYLDIDNFKQDFNTPCGETVVIINDQSGS